MASRWLLPVEPTGQGSYALGRNTTNYGPPPTSAGLGYAFSGGAPDVDHAMVVTCNGRPDNFVLDAGGTADIQLLTATGAPLTASSQGIPPDNFYLPGLDNYAALETAPISSDGHQILSQLAAGVLRISWTMSSFNCSGTGTVAGGMLITAGHTTTITCRES